MSDSISQEIKATMVSDDIHLQRILSKSNETQAGVDTTYPLLKTPAYKLVQSGQCAEILETLGFNSPTASIHIRPIAQRLEFHNSMISTVVGDDSSILSSGIPTAKYSLLSDTGAGQSLFDATIIPSCAHYNYQNSGCDSAIAVSVPLRCNQNTNPFVCLRNKQKEERYELRHGAIMDK